VSSGREGQSVRILALPEVTPMIGAVDGSVVGVVGVVAVADGPPSARDEGDHPE